MTSISGRALCISAGQCNTTGLLKVLLFHKILWNILKTMFLNVKIAKALQISSSTVHNIIKRFRETGEISVRKGQDRRRFLDVRGLIGMILSLTLLNGPRNTFRIHCR